MSDIDVRRMLRWMLATLALVALVFVVVVAIALLARVVPQIAGSEPKDCHNHGGIARLIDPNDDDHAKAVCGDGHIVSISV